MSALARLLGGVRQAVLWIARVAWIVAGVAILGMMLIIIYDVVARYVFLRPTEWVFTVSSTSLLAVSFLALPHLYARDQHISVDLLYNALPSGVRRVTDLVVRVVAIIFGLSLTWLGITLMQGALAGGLRTAGVFSLPVWLVSIPIPFGGALLALVALLSQFSPDRRLGSGTDGDSGQRRR